MPMRDWTSSRAFSRTGRPGNTLVIWKERPIPSRVRACGERRVMSRPLNRMLPRVGFSCPLSRLKKVVFPAPLGPMMDVRRFFGMLTLTPLTATCPPKETVKSRVSSRVSIGSSLPSDEERHAPLLPAVGCRSAALTACFRPAAPPPPVKFRGSTPAPAHRNLLSFPAHRVHRLKGLMIFRAVRHLPLGCFKRHALHRLNQPLRLRIPAGFFQGFDNRDRRG